jgi:hypothetical protein
MSYGTLRKRLERVEKMLKPRIEAAALARAPAPQCSQQEDDRGLFGILRMLQMLRGSLSAEDKATFERLRALYPDEEETTSPEGSAEDFFEQIRSGEYARSLQEILDDKS